MVEHTLQNRPVYNTKAIVITDGAAQDVENLQTTSDLAKVYDFKSCKKKKVVWASHIKFCH